MPVWAWILIFFGAVVLLGAISDWRTKSKRNKTMLDSEMDQGVNSKIEKAKDQHVKHMNNFHGF